MVTSVLKLVVIYGDDDYGEHIVAATAAAANYPFDVDVDVDVVSRSCLFVRHRLHPLPVVRSCVTLVEVVSIVIKEVSLNALLLTSSLVAISFVDDEQHAICCNK